MNRHTNLSTFVLASITAILMIIFTTFGAIMPSTYAAKSPFSPSSFTKSSSSFTAANPSTCSAIPPFSYSTISPFSDSATLPFSVSATTAISGPVPQNTRIITGAERFNVYLHLLKGASVAIFANQTSIVGKSHLVDTLQKQGIHIAKIFSPEHGFRGDADAGAKVASSVDPATGIPIISLYGSKSKPSADDLADVDVLLFDIQDVGVRFYTYISSLQKYLESAVENRKPVIVLDRPNPNGFYVDGPVLEKKFSSFVGKQPIPVVYGMTMAEYATMLIGEKWLDSGINAAAGTVHIYDKVNVLAKSAPHPLKGTKDFQLIIIPCAGYTHESRYTLPVPPSPNLPNMQSVYLYPSLCFFEGADISLGRGTDKPFQQFGSPKFPKIGYHFTVESTPGARNPPLLNQTCYGYDLSKIDVSQETSNRLCLKWLIQAYQLYPDKDSFFLKNNFFNRLAGTDQLQNQIRQGLTEEQIRNSWESGLAHFLDIRKKYLLYP